MCVRNFRYLTRKVADRGYFPFVVIRPENTASHSLYKKLGFRQLYQIVRMIFTPATWQENDNDANVLRDNLENAVRQLTIEQRVITALSDQKESGETIQDPAGTEEEEKKEEDANKEEILETIEEQSDERIDVADNTTADNAAEVEEDCGAETTGGDE